MFEKGVGEADPGTIENPDAARGVLTPKNIRYLIFYQIRTGIGLPLSTANMAPDARA